MKRSTLFIGLGLYALLWFIVYMNRVHVGAVDVFGGDGTAYSGAAQNLLRSGFYSLDGIHAFTEREPGYSAFLAILYFFMGTENVLALYIAQAALIFVSTYLLVRELSTTIGDRIATVCFFLTIISFSVFHAVFSGFREAFTLALLMSTAAVYLSFMSRQTLLKALLFGVLLGCAILTYYSFVFFPFFLAGLLCIHKVPWRSAVVMTLVPLIFAGAWMLRNASYSSESVAGGRLAAVWYVRGEQAANIHGLEPLWCLEAEYITRDWSGRSPDCSFNNVKNTRWPQGLPTSAAEAQAASKAGQQKIFQNFGSYLWFSVFEILEYHLPFVGGGWSFLMNALAALSMIPLYIGFVLGLPLLRDRHLQFFTLLALYNMLFFILTDATPRYLIPVIFCYAVVAAMGYGRNWFRRTIAMR